MEHLRSVLLEVRELNMTDKPKMSKKRVKTIKSAVSKLNERATGKPSHTRGPKPKKK